MRVLALSGGGARGAFQAGALYQLVPRRRYDAVVGCSIGAVNTAIFLSQPTQALGAQTLRAAWSSFTRSRLMTYSMSNLVANQGLASLAPLRSYLSDLGISPRAVPGYVGAVSLSCRNPETDGSIRSWCSKDPDFHLGVQASASIPGLFPPVEQDGHLYADLGLRDQSPINLAIGLGADTIDLIQTSTPYHRGEAPVGIIPSLLRASEIIIKELEEGDIRDVRLHNSLICAGQGVPGKRLITLNCIRPSRPILDNLLDDDHSRIRELISHGDLIARSSLARLEGE